MLTQISILMAVRDGAAFLPAQLDSLARQDHRNWRLWASDDGSTDDSAAILRGFAARHGVARVTVLAGPEQGAAANFRSLIRRAETGADHVAFCDQDDVWDEDRLSRGLALMLAKAPADRPALAGSRLRICDVRLAPIGLSPLPHRPLGFANALVQNILSGNTLLLSPAAMALLRAAEAEASTFPVHDWWAYQLITGAGGVALYDPAPSVSYRQHGGNAIGAGQGLMALARRAAGLLGGAYGDRLRLATAALAASNLRLTEANRSTLRQFETALDATPIRRPALLRASGVYHQRNLQGRIFRLSALLGLV